MIEFFKSYRRESERDNLDLTKCSKCGCYFLDKDCAGICDGCSKETKTTKTLVKRMTTDIVKFINR